MHELFPPRNLTNASKALTYMRKCKVGDKETTGQQQILRWKNSWPSSTNGQL